MEIVATDRKGSSQRIAAKLGQSVMVILKEAGLDVAAICGGNCICATCHIYVDQAWLEKLNPADEPEVELLGQLQHTRPDSRLACQIPFTATLDGLAITLALEE